MIGRRVPLGLLFAILTLALPAFRQASAAPGRAKALLADPVRKTLVHDGQTRTYYLYLPSTLKPGRPAPLVFVLHGGGGTAEGMEHDLTRRGFDWLAERDRFLVAYPQGLARQWNDGRGAVARGLDRVSDVDDVGFFRAMIEAIGAETKIDRKRVYATGISNGGLMSLRLAGDMADTFAAIAPVTANLSRKLSENYVPTAPVSVFLLNGAEDPLVPYEGGAIRVFSRTVSRGEVLSTAATVEFWVKRNGCDPEPSISLLPDRDPSDGTRVRRSLYRGGKAGTEVLLYSIQGGGHTWPGGPQYLPASWVGRVCRDLDANEVIWEFFKAHPKR